MNAESDVLYRNCLPDHKFSEIRWDADTKAENPDNMTNEEIGCEGCPWYDINRWRKEVKKKLGEKND